MSCENTTFTGCEQLHLLRLQTSHDFIVLELGRRLDIRRFVSSLTMNTCIDVPLRSLLPFDQLDERLRDQISRRVETKPSLSSSISILLLQV